MQGTFNEAQVGSWEWIAAWAAHRSLYQFSGNNANSSCEGGALLCGHGQRRAKPETGDSGLGFRETAAGCACGMEHSIGTRTGERRRRRAAQDLLHHPVPCLLHPSIFSDVNGEYLGFDEHLHHARGRTQYANYSGWDIYRCQVQLITMLMPKVGSDMAQSLVADAEQGGGLPRWSVANSEAGSMVGDPSDLILASIYAFGGRDFDTSTALKAMLRGANDPTTHILSGYRTASAG